MVKQKERHQQFNNLYDEEEEYYACMMWLSFIDFLMFANYLLSHVGQMLFGGNKGEELHCVRKDLEKDIFLPLGDYYFRKSYCMKKKNFYKLHSALEPYL
eukprot:4752386-Ditylum_brightwellii.AAC.1